MKTRVQDLSTEDLLTRLREVEGQVLRAGHAVDELSCVVSVARSGGAFRVSQL